LDLNLPDSQGPATFDKAYAEISDVPIVVLTGEFDEALGPATVLKGAQDYLVKKTADSASLARVLRYALARHQAQQEKIKSSQSHGSGRVIGFIGAKGGVGTTTTALNVAVALAMKGKSVILAEIRPTFGTLAFHLNQHPAKNLRTLLDIPPERIGRHELNSVLCKGPAGLWLLFGPKEQEDQFPEIDPRQAEAIVKGLSQLAEFVILDLPSQPSAATRAVVGLCQFAAVVSEREPGSVRAGKAVVKQLEAWGARGNLVGGIVRIGAIIVNRVIFPINMLNLAEIQSQMGCEIVAVIPSAASENVRALTDGVPLVLLQPDSDIALTFGEIAVHLSTDNEVAIHHV
jgi:MinD-like ATPase involved in chromosome partitioning or flagellar assembly